MRRRGVPIDNEGLNVDEVGKKFKRYWPFHNCLMDFVEKKFSKVWLMVHNTMNLMNLRNVQWSRVLENSVSCSQRGNYVK